MEYIRLRDVDLQKQVGQRVFVCFVMRNKTVREQKDGVTKFVTFDMVDKDTVVDAKIFGVTTNILEMLSDGVVYNAAVDIKEYSKSKTGYSCIIYNIEKTQIQPQAFVDWAPNLEDQAKIIQDALVEIIETHYGRITYQIVLRYWSKFSQWQAASGQHHTQMGGLLTHTAEVVSQCKLLAEYFNDKYGENFINEPLLIQAAILHDIGKCNELDVDVTQGNTKYSTYATLQTHIMDILQDVATEAYKLGIGYQQVQQDQDDEDTENDCELKTQEQIDSEVEAVKLLQHLLAQHHGKLEWGQPITPNTPEAFILNLADELSAQMFKYNREFKNMEPGTSQTKWGSQMTSMYKDTQKWSGSEFDNLD